MVNGPILEEGMYKQEIMIAFVVKAVLLCGLLIIPEQ